MLMGILHKTKHTTVNVCREERMSKTEQTNKGINRREFGQALSAAGMAAFGGALATPFALAAEKEEDIQKSRSKGVSYLEGADHQIDESVYKRFSSKNNAFNAYSRDLGMSWVRPWYGNRMKALAKGSSGMFTDAGSPASARSFAALSEGLNFMNYVTGPYGTGMENAGLLSWNNPLAGDPRVTPPYMVPGQMPPDLKDAKQLTLQAKVVARLVGADLVGICKLDRRWVFGSTQRNSYTAEDPVMKDLVFKDQPMPEETETELMIPEDVQYAIVLGFAQNRVMMQSAPSACAAATVSFGYSRMGIGATSLAQYIRGLGYTALPAKNDTALSVPLAVDAGLGESSRMGLVITPEFGANIRIAKVLTNMPLVPDKPIQFGVKEFCKVCKKCARECPSKAISLDEPGWKARNDCNNPGILKWYNDHKKCLQYWIDNGYSCIRCVAVCPFTKGSLVGHDISKWSIKNAKFMNKLWVSMDDAFGWGVKRDPRELWQTRVGTYGLDPEKFHGTNYNG
jgi:tetrachloroethene reductive dehalogenase